MEESFNPLDLLECDVVEDEGEVQIPDVNKDGTEDKDGNGEVSAEMEHSSQLYLQTPEPIFDLVHYTFYPHPPAPLTVDANSNKNPGTPVQEFIRPKLLRLINPRQDMACSVATTAVVPSSVIRPLPPLTAAPTVLKVWNSSTIPIMPKLMPIPRPIPSTSVVQHPPVNLWNHPMSSEIQPEPSTSASSPPVIDLEKDPLAIRPHNTALLCSHGETSFRSELQRHISKYSITFFRLHCTSCGVHIKSTLFTVDGAFKIHKYLRVLVCQKCSEYYGNGFFPVEEGSDIYCYWCGNGGNLYCCSNCTRSFCQACVIRNFGLEVNKQIAEKENWACFVCDFYLEGKLLWAHRAIPSILQKHIKQLRSETTLLEGEQKTKALKQDFSLCCTTTEVTETIEVVLPYSIYSKIQPHLVTKLYKLVCKPGTEPAQKKPSMFVAEETRPGCVSVGQKSVTAGDQLVEVGVPAINLSRGNLFEPSSSENIKWLSKIFSESEEFINDFKTRLSYCILYSKKNRSNLSVNCVINNLESLFKTAIGNMKIIHNNIEREKKRTLKGSKSHVAVTSTTNINEAAKKRTLQGSKSHDAVTSTTNINEAAKKQTLQGSKSHVAVTSATDINEAANINEVNMSDSNKMEVEKAPLLSEPQVLQTENKENQFNKNNVDASQKSVDSSKDKVNSRKKNQPSLTTLSRKRKLETCNKNDTIVDYKHLFKKYKLKNCNVVLQRTDLTNMYNLKKCNVVLKKTDVHK